MLKNCPNSFIFCVSQEILLRYRISVFESIFQGENVSLQDLRILLKLKMQSHQGFTLPPKIATVGRFEPSLNRLVKMTIKRITSISLFLLDNDYLYM